jgi:hypothetical protein
MAHVTADLLASLLDGSLDELSRRAVQEHLAVCPKCAAQLAATRRLIDETSELVGVFGGVSPSIGSASARGPGRRTPDSYSPGAAPPPPGAAGGPSEPVVLIPFPPESPSFESSPAPRRRRAVLIAAAAFVLCAGVLAAVIHNGREPVTDSGSLVLAPFDETRPPPAAPPTHPVPAAPVSRAVDSMSQTAFAGRTSAPAPTPAAPEPPSDRARASTADDAVDTSLADSDEADAPAPAPREPARRRGATRDTTSIRLGREAAAAAATEELDRRLQRKRAAAVATAGLDRPARQAPLPEPVAPPPASAASSAAVVPPGAIAGEAPAPPEPPSIERAAGLERRIGLDEAARTLGEPVHVVEGLRAQAVGVLDGKHVAGADPSRPVVRVVYSTPSGGLVVLDQQRHVEGDRVTAGPNGPRWLQGRVVVYLHGRATADELRDLSERVR